VIVTKEMHNACRSIVSAPDVAYGSTVKERAQEVLDHTYVGQNLKSWQVELLQCLRSRFQGYYGPGEEAFEEAFAKAYDLWKA
jgi:hypothetical protein